MLIVDTDVLSLVHRREGEGFSRLSPRLRASTEPICVTIVSFEEQLRGWLSYLASARTTEKRIHGYGRLRALLDYYGTSTVIDFDAAADAQFQRLTKAKVRIGTMDLRIAAIALAHDALLVSRNLVDFRKVPGLPVEDWTA